MADILCACLVVLGGTAGAFILDWLNRRVIEPWRIRVAQAEWDHQRLRRLDDARWFSDDPPTMRAMMRLADGHSVSDVRDEWRRARAASPQAKEGQS